MAVCDDESSDDDDDEAEFVRVEPSDRVGGVPAGDGVNVRTDKHSVGVARRL